MVLIKPVWLDGGAFRQVNARSRGASGEGFIERLWGLERGESGAMKR
ncbi:hypothetical protein [Mycobacterium sp.]